MYSLYVFIVSDSRRHLVLSLNNEESSAITITFEREEDGQVRRRYSTSLLVPHLIGSYLVELDEVVHKYGSYFRIPT